jgi:RNA polymerase sigma-70 factor, ECF subfamily
MVGPNGEGSEGDLLERMIAGDEQAFTALYRRWQGPLYRFALQMTGTPQVAEEVIQETFMTLIWKARSFDPARGTLGAFLYGVCRKHVLRTLDQERTYVSLEADANGNGPDEPSVTPDWLADFAAAETIERVRSAVLSLPPSYREVVVLCDLHEMSYLEAAQALACAVGTVRSRLHRARALLAAKLARGEFRPVAAAVAARKEDAAR